MKRGRTGDYVASSLVGGESYQSFVPSPLPPDPPVQLDENLREMMDRALLSLGRLDAVSALLPDTSLFLYMYIRKEAVLSSQIEGTQSSLSDLLLFESNGAPGVPTRDVQEVSNYVAAMYHGLERVHSGFPISLRLIREIHGVLLSKGRGSEKEPGEFRRTQNWIGGSRPGNASFVPPPPERVMECMGKLEEFLHDKPSKTELLVKAALAHVQFETIHPFLDGNGRLGRLLITFLFCAGGALAQPMLYLSLYFKKNRHDYYGLLQQVRLEGDWESWISFFATGVRDTADSAVKTANALANMFERDRQRIGGMGRIAGSALRVHRALQEHPVISLGGIAEATALSIPTVTATLNALTDLGIVSELTGHRRYRLYGYKEYIDKLNEGTEPL